MSNFGTDATCTVYFALSLVEALHMGNQESGNLITFLAKPDVINEAKRNKKLVNKGAWKISSMRI